MLVHFVWNPCALYAVQAKIVVRMNETACAYASLLDVAVFPISFAAVADIEVVEDGVWVEDTIVKMRLVGM